MADIIDYSVKVKKREIQHEIFSQVKSKKIVTLGGPSIDNYVPLLRSYGFEEIISFETNIEVFLRQCSLASKFDNVTIKYGSILDNLDKYPGYFFDLDFCATIKPVERYLQDIAKLEEYCLTFALRPIGEELTKKIFYSYVPNFKIELRWYKDKGHQKMFNIIKRK